MPLVVEASGRAAVRELSFEREGQGVRVHMGLLKPTFVVTEAADGWKATPQERVAAEAALSSSATPLAASNVPSGPIILATDGGVAVPRQALPSTGPSDTTARQDATRPASGPIVLAGAPPPAAILRSAPAAGSPSAPAPSSREALMQAQIATRREQAAREAAEERERLARIERERVYAKQQQQAAEANQSSFFGDLLAFGGAMLGGVAAGMQNGSDMDSITAGMALGATLVAPDSEITAAANKEVLAVAQRQTEERAFNDSVIAAMHDPNNPLTQQQKRESDARQARDAEKQVKRERENREAKEAADRDALVHQLRANQQQADGAADDQLRADEAKAEASHRRQEQADRQARQQQLALEKQAQREAEERSRQNEERRLERERARETERQRLAAAEAERTRVIDYKEGVTLCSLSGPQAQFGNWTCNGPLQMNYVNFDRDNWHYALDLTGCTDARELPRAGTYRAFGCGYGIHPTNPGALRHVPEMLGVFVDGRATFRCSRSSTDVCRSR